ncbi:hepatocyte growth factor-regulated tyrosine kinase substrate [Fistulifera solaris]|uniref:sn-1-specific diacylglycerol lipase n=1 Tax=Fistulifera solaris TaxID=1519565 RepID=A0A1Z5JQY0_FISSO|nr:hepatocyte growth factor-regulated tyrosine kinase substrate [Fistulifera solaris]|eukprot:GAX16262.1 hepatocyte growth factor-regulated tyrosine kinase substrate [Fistulifera solaris]
MTSVIAARETRPSYLNQDTIASDTESVESIEENDDDLLPVPQSWFEECDNYDLEKDDTERTDEVTLHREIYPSASSNRTENDCHVDARLDSVRNVNTNFSGTISAPAPSWKEISKEVIPMAARELLTSTMSRIHRTARFAYCKGRWKRQYSELGNNATGYFRPNVEAPELPPFSSLVWIERQLVKEWRTYLPEEETVDALLDSPMEDDFTKEDADFHRARTLVPTPMRRPPWQKAESCFSCNKTFGPTRLRHHCRLCGKSFCHAHSSCSHRLPHLGYHPDVPERVCDDCKIQLLEHNLAERVAWRLARCRDHKEGNLRPYFDTGVDSLEEVAVRIAEAAITMAKKIPLGAQAAVAVETADVLRKYGLNGIYTIMLRKEFLAAADLLQKTLNINRNSWPLSVHELSAAIFYALAQHRAMRGLNPDHEHKIHAIRAEEDNGEGEQSQIEKPAITQTGHGNVRQKDGICGDASDGESEEPRAVCDRLPDATLESLIFYAPIALNFIYAEKEVDMQLLAAQQGWRLVYAHLHLQDSELGYDLPASALFVHDQHKIACLSIRGTSSIQDVVTDIRQAPLPFPDLYVGSATESAAQQNNDDWTEVHEGQGLAVCGMANAAINLHREHIDALVDFAKRGFRIRLTGHSLGGAVATLLGILVLRNLKKELPEHFSSSSSVEINKSSAEQSILRVYAYGTPPCIDVKLSDFVGSFVTTAVLHDDAVPRLTLVSCRELLKFLLHIRETWVKEHLPDDILAITDRAKSVWAPRWREGFTLSASSKQLKRYCKSQIIASKQRLLSVKDILVKEDQIFEGNTNEDITTWESQGWDVNTRTSPDWKTDANDVPVALAVDYMGGLDSRSAPRSLVIDDDEYYDPDEKLLEESDDEEFNDALDQDIAGESTSAKSTSACNDSCQNEKDDQEPVILEESPLPRMFVPGKIAHIYAHRGVYKAVYVPRDFRELRRVSLAGNMLSDHKCKNYYEALMEVRTVRRAQEAPPRWTAYDEDDTWYVS